MNKKIFFSIFILSSLLLSSCWVKTLWTFNDELKAEQVRYTQNISKYFDDLKDFEEWKFISDWKINLAASVKDIWDVNFDIDYNSKTILEKWSFAFLADFLFNLYWKTEKNLNDFVENQNLWLEWLDWKITFWSKYAVLDKKVYLSVDNFNIDSKTIEESSNTGIWISAIKSYLPIVKPYIDSFNKNLSKKWLSINLDSFNKKFFEEYSKSLARNKETISLIKENIIFFLTQDIFKPEDSKIKYEGKDAYKFTIDDVKFKTSFIKFFSKIVENGENFNISEDEKDIILKDIEKNISENLYIKDSEWYLVRSSWDDVNLIIKNITFASKNSEESIKMSLEILDRDLKISIYNIVDWNQKLILSLNFKAKGKWFIEYLWELNIEEIQNNLNNNSLKFNWFSQYTRNGNELSSKFSLNLEPFLKIQTKQWEKDLSYKILINNVTKKDNKLVIDEKAILWDNKAMNLEEYNKVILETFPELKFLSSIFEEIISQWLKEWVSYDENDNNFEI